MGYSADAPVNAHMGRLVSSSLRVLLHLGERVSTRIEGSRHCDCARVTPVSATAHSVEHCLNIYSVSCLVGVTAPYNFSRPLATGEALFAHSKQNVE